MVVPFKGPVETEPDVLPEVSKPVPVHETALVEAHVSVDDWSACMLPGFAISVTVGAGGGFTVSVADAVAV